MIFVAVSWQHLGVGGRSAVMAGITALAAAGAVGAHRRGLLSTAEWLSLLTVGLALLDCYGARSADLAGLASADGAVFWAGAVAVVAAGAALLAVLLPTRALPLTAALLGQLPLPLIAAHLVADVSRPLALVATLLAVQAVVGLAAAASWPAGTRTADARAVVGGGAVLALVAAALAAGGAAYGEEGSLAVGTALLVGLAAVPALAGTLLARGRPDGDERVAGCDATAAVLLVAAAWAPLVDRVDDAWTGPSLSVPVLLLLAALLLAPRARRVAPAGVLLLAGLVPLLTALEGLGAAVDRMLVALRVPDEAWSIPAREAAASAVWPDVVALVATGTALLLGAQVLRVAAPRVAAPRVAAPRVAALRVAALPVLAAAGWLVAPASSASFPVQLGTLLALAAALLVAGAQLDVRGRVWPGWTALWCGAVAVGLAVVWCFATPTATLVTLPAAAAALALGTVSARGAEGLRVWRVLLVLATLLLGLTEAGALARHDGAGWPAVWSVVLVLATAIATGVALLLALRTAATDAFWAPLHTSAVVVATASAVAAGAAVADWQGVALAGSGLAAVCVAALLTLGSCAPLPTGRPVRDTVQVVAAVTAAPALALSALDADRLWVALLARRCRHRGGRPDVRPARARLGGRGPPRGQQLGAAGAVRRRRARGLHRAGGCGPARARLPASSARPGIRLVAGVRQRSVAGPRAEPAPRGHRQRQRATAAAGGRRCGCRRGRRGAPAAGAAAPGCRRARRRRAGAARAVPRRGLPGGAALGHHRLPRPAAAGRRSDVRTARPRSPSGRAATSLVWADSRNAPFAPVLRGPLCLRCVS